MKKKPAVRHRLSTVQRIFFSYVFICLVPVVILAGVLAVSTFRAQQREDAARQAHTAELAARTLDAEFKRVQGLGQQLSETQWVKRRGAAAGLYDEEFGLREKLAICGDLRGYTAASGVIRQLSVVFPEKEEVYSSAGFYDTADFFRTFSLEKGQTPLESAVVYERLSLPENSGLVCGAQLGMTGGAASRLFFAEAMEYNRPMRSFLLVELDRSAIRNQIALLRTDDMPPFLSAARTESWRGYPSRPGPQRLIILTAPYVSRWISRPAFPPCRWYGHEASGLSPCWCLFQCC